MTAAPRSRAAKTHPPHTHCRRGHPLTEANSYYKGNGHRECLTCRKAREAAQAARRLPARTTDHEYIDGDWYLDLVSAICRQALDDYMVGYTTPHTPSAAAFLGAAGMLCEDGSIDWHGRTPRTPRRRVLTEPDEVME